MEDHELNKLLEVLASQPEESMPLSGHQERFRLKLKKSNRLKKRKRLRNTFLKVAAGILLLLGLFNPLFFQSPSGSDQEIASFTFYFSGIINDQLEALDARASEQTQFLVSDTLKRMHLLEEQYQSLETDLQSGGDSQRIIRAMITNYNLRITLLNTALEQLDNLETLKDKPHENTI